MFDWIKRWIGPGRRELRAEAELWRVRCERSNSDRDRATRVAKQMRREAGQERHRGDVLEAKLRSAMQQLALAAEPERTPGCAKVRFHQRSEAEQWMRQVLEDTGGQDGEMKTYPCRACPRSPVTMARYWHVGHPAKGREARDAAKERARAATRAARTAGRTIAQQISPEVLAVLRTMSGDGR